MHRFLTICTSIWFVVPWASATAGAAELFVARPLTPEGSFTAGIEGPACDRQGAVFAVNFQREGTIGRATPDGKGEVFVELPAGSVGNGIRFDRQGMMYVADYTRHNVLRIDPRTRTVTVFAHEDRMNQPNDLAIGPDETLYASDPNWKQGTGQLWRIDRSGRVTRLAADMGTTNGIEVNPDGKLLYVNETVQRKVWAFSIQADHSLAGKRLVIEFPDFGMDGMRCDVDGNLYITRHGKGTVVKVSPQGKVLREIDVLGKMPTNICFGGPDGRTAYVTEVQHRRLVEFRVDRPGLSWKIEQPMWKAGTARAKITPKRPLWLAGYGGRVRPAEGTMQELWVKALALEASDGQRGVIVTSDLLGFPKGIADAICADLQKRFGLKRAQIMLTCSHTHCGPVLKDALYDIYPLDDKQRAMIAEYSGELIKTVVATVGEALGHTAPATLWSGDGQTDFAVNRRNNTEATVARLRQEGKPLKGPVDHSVPVLAVRAADGRLVAVVFLYACHNTTLDFYQWSGDYAGVAQIALEEKYPRAQAMFTIGCGADQNPLPRRTVALCEKYGRMLAEAVATVLDKPMAQLPPHLATRFEIVPLGFEGHLDRGRLQADAGRSDYLGRYARRMLSLMSSGQPLPQSYPYPVQVWRFGAAEYWIALGGEVVVDYAAAMKARFGPLTRVVGYANDAMSYIPSARVWKEGGYEAGAFNVYGLPVRRWAADIETRIVDAASRLVRSVQASDRAPSGPRAPAKPPAER